MGFLATSKIPILLTLHLYPISYNTRLNASNTTCNHPQDEFRMYFYTIKFTEFRFDFFFENFKLYLENSEKLWPRGSRSLIRNSR